MNRFLVVLVGAVCWAATDTAFSADYSWVTYGNHKYALTQNAGSWEACENEAVLAGGHLATINDAGENAFLTDFIKDTYIPGYPGYPPSSNGAWIGLYLTGSDMTDPSSWRWVSGEPVTYWNPSSNFPLDGTYMYLHGANQESQPGKWNNNSEQETTYQPFGIIEAVRTPAEQIQDILDFIDASVAAGTLKGVGPGMSARNRLKAFTNMIGAAASLIEEGAYEESYEQLNSAYGKCDGKRRPPDFVQGTARQELADMILALMEDLLLEMI